MSAQVLNLIDRLAGLFGHGTTCRSASAEFGYPPAYVWRRELAAMTDTELTLAERDQVIAEALRRAQVVNERRAGRAVSR